MALRKRKPAPQTPADVHRSINTLTATALSHFEDAVLDLDEAAAQHSAHASVLDEEIRELVAVRQKSEKDAQSAINVADKIRALVTPDVVEFE